VIRRAVGLGLTWVLVWTLPAGAQMVPEGSYLESCSAIRMNGTLLSATCNRAAGGTARTSVDIRDCTAGNIENHDGTLACTSTTAAEFNYLPGGSYLESCSGISRSGLVLSATCSAPNGSQVQSSLDLTTCRHGAGIQNRNGNLACGAGGRWTGGLPQGSYRQSCQELSMSGMTLSASCTNPNGSLVRTSLDVTRCQWGSGIRNENGQLTCATYR